MNGSYPSRAGGFNQGLLAGAQLGMQFFQLKRQGDAIKREKDVGALNAQFKMLEFQLPYLSEEQVNKRVKNLSKDFDKVYKTKFGIENIEFGGRGKEVFKELQKIEKDILGRKITNEVQVNAAVAKARLKFPHNKAYIDKRGKDLIGGFQSLVETKRWAEDMILKMSDKYKAIGQTPEGAPTVGLLPPGKMKAGETPTQGAGATGLEPSGLLNMGGYQWQPKPQKYVPTTEEEALRLRQAGALSITQIIGQEKFEIQKGQTAGTLRTNLVAGKDKRTSFEENGFQYNNINTKNEVAYWDTQEKWYQDEKTKIIKLLPAATKAGWTPSKIQEVAIQKGKTVKEVLIDLGILE